MVEKQLLWMYLCLLFPSGLCIKEHSLGASDEVTYKKFKFNLMLLVLLDTTGCMYITHSFREVYSIAVDIVIVLVLPAP